MVIDSGLKAGEDVVSVGGLILAQIYEDLKTGQTGAPAARQRTRTELTAVPSGDGSLNRTAAQFAQQITDNIR